MNYRNEDELNYFGSDLNKFTNEFCSKEMVVNNIDMIQFKKLKDKKYIRIIESKHSNEKTSRGQDYILRVLASVFKELNGSSKTTHEYGVYIATGDYPYETAKIKNLVEDKEHTVTQEELIDFLEFRKKY